MSGLVLVADGDAERGKRIAEACSARGLDCVVKTHGAAALEAALAEPPRALVAQLELPLIDGARLATILRANPCTHGLSIFLVADRSGGTPPGGLPGPLFGPPADVDAIARNVQAAVERHRAPADAGAGGEGGVEGQLAQLSLADLLQLFHVSRKTGTVEVVREEPHGRRRTGRIYLRGGDVIQGVVGTVDGEKALFRLLAWDRGTFAFKPHPVTISARIQHPTRTLLREGQRQLEEWQRLAVELPAADAEVGLRIQRAALPSVIHPLTQEVLVAVELYSRVGDILDHCSYPDYQVLRTLHTLIGRGMLELRHEPAGLGATAEPGLFSAAHAQRLREWIDAARARGGAAPGAKLLVVSGSPEATASFASLLARLPGVELAAAARAGQLAPDDLAPLGRLAVDAEVGVEFIHVPASERFAPLWRLAGHGALGTLCLLAAPVDAAAARVRAATAVLRGLPRARLFHLLLLGEGQRVHPETLQDNLSLLDDGSLFLIPLASAEKAGVLLREMFARVLP